MKRLKVYVERLEERIVPSGPAPEFNAGPDPRSVAAADFNRDGNLDVAAVNGSSNAVSILMGDGHGSLGARLVYVVGAGPRSVAAADFDGQNGPDLAVVNRNDSTVSVLLNKGNGAFDAAVPYATGTTPEYVVAADVNGDGKTDLVVANNGSNNISVLISNGDGTFAAQKTFSVGASPRSVTVGRFNNDDIPDIVTANGDGNTVSVLLGTGSGNFGSAATIAVGSYAQDVATGDFNGDGFSDIAVTNYVDNTLSVLRCQGDGTFAPQVVYDVGQWPWGIEVGNFNGDVFPDLVVANSFDGTISILTGRADGTFDAQYSQPVGSSPVELAVGNFNHGGADSIVVANRSGGTVSVVLKGVGKLTASSGDHTPAASEMQNGAADQVVAQVALAAGVQEDITVSSVSLTGSGSLNDATGITSVRLFNDVNKDGLYESSVDTQVGTAQTFTQDNGTVTFSGLGHVVTAGSTEDWLIVYDIAATAPNGQTFAAALTSVTATGATTGAAVTTAGLPVTGSTMTIPQPVHVLLDGKHAVPFTDSNGNSVTAFLRNGTGYFTLTNKLRTGADISGVFLTSSSASTQLQILSKADTTVGGIAEAPGTAGSVGIVDMKTAVLTGDIRLTGSLGKLTAKSVGNGVTIQALSAATSTSVTLGRIGANVDMDLAGTVASFKAASWQSGWLHAGTVKLLSIGDKKSADPGDFGGDLKVLSDASAISIKGSAPGVFDIGGQVKSLTVGGSLGNSAFSTDLKAAAIGSLSVGGTLFSDVHLTGSLGKLTGKNVGDGVIVEAPSATASSSMALAKLGKNVTIDLGGAVTSFRALSWESGLLEAGSVKLLSIGDKTSADPANGSFGGNLTVLGDASAISIKGSAPGEFDIGGQVKSMTVGGSLGAPAGGTSLKATAINSLSVGGKVYSAVTVSGALGTIQTNPSALNDHVAHSGKGVGDLVGKITANSIRTIRIGGDVIGDIEVTGTVAVGSIQTDDLLLHPGLPFQWQGGGTLICDHAQKFPKVSDGR